MPRICPFSSSAPRPLGAAYIPILLSEVEQEQRPSGNGDCEAILVGAGLCDDEGERAYTGYAPHIIRNVSANVFSLRRFCIIFRRNVRRHVFAETFFPEKSGIPSHTSSLPISQGGKNIYGEGVLSGKAETSRERHKSAQRLGLKRSENRPKVRPFRKGRIVKKNTSHMVIFSAYRINCGGRK